VGDERSFFGLLFWKLEACDFRVRRQSGVLHDSVADWYSAGIPEIAREIHEMVHAPNHALVPSGPTTNSALSASGNTTAGTMTYSSMGLDV